MDSRAPQNEAGLIDSLDRRGAPDRRTQTLRSLLRGSFLRRRHGPRRVEDASLAVTDWYAPQWLAAGLLILILCVVDALLTLALLNHGAIEANPVMNSVVHGDGWSFAAMKFGLTSSGVVVLILLARVKAFGRVPVSALLYGVLAGYLWLIVYEFSLLRTVVPDFF
ncbi:MAG TPA: DUF5658 family protein [Steroidobacteraceae bacterium]|nr:DUF5658 family protein [Steroidobacteraceae bacterium]